ncbi:MAG: methylmalonyl Co-A mutase-associated GTPase MeaB [Flavobacteriales bacterium]|nr:methylmalonyl Co-A mutase-associated GTPase MeaB [Flavobacteriales bacterium]
MNNAGKEKAAHDATDRIRDRRGQLDPDKLYDKLVSGDRVALAQAITLTENKLDRSAAEKLLSRIPPSDGTSYRIAVTGVPGAGKSTFIEALGLHVVRQGAKVAVLAIDPTSPVGGGSILGDKTRMNELARHERAYVRPSPSGGARGGLGTSTMEAVMLCEAAGFEYIFIETVGVGQGEIAAGGVCDIFLLLALARAGDQLQGIKRGIMEMADALLITKADGDNEHAARLAKAEYLSALHLLPPKESGWQPATELVSAQTGLGIEKVWDIVLKHRDWVTGRGTLVKHRRAQEKEWIRAALESGVLEAFRNRPDVNEALKNADRLIESGAAGIFGALGNLRKLI